MSQKILRDKYMFNDSAGEVIISIDQNHMSFEDSSASVFYELEMKRKNPTVKIEFDRVKIIKQNIDTGKK